MSRDNSVGLHYVTHSLGTLYIWLSKHYDDFCPWAQHAQAYRSCEQMARALSGRAGSHAGRQACVCVSSQI